MNAKQTKTTTTKNTTTPAKATDTRAEFAQALQGLNRHDLAVMGEVVRMLVATREGDYKQAAVHCLAASVLAPDLALANILVLNGQSPAVAIPAE